MSFACTKHKIIICDCYGNKVMSLESELNALREENGKLNELVDVRGGNILALKKEIDGWITRTTKSEAERDRLRAYIQKAIMRLGSPTMGYKPEIAVREYQEQIEEATRVLLKALAEGKQEAGGND